MAYFLRFTINAASDLDRGFSSHHADDANNSEQLSGLCGFELEAENVEKAIEEANNRFGTRADNHVYNMESFGSDWAIFRGKYVDSVPDGHVFLPFEIAHKPVL